MHFRALTEVRVGDDINIETAGGSPTVYIVRSIRILLPAQVSAVLNDPENRNALHLLVCYPFRYLGAAPKRFLVTATKRESQTSATASRLLWKWFSEAAPQQLASLRGERFRDGPILLLYASP